MKDEGFSKREWQNAYRECKSQLDAAQQRVAFLTDQCRILCKSHTEINDANLTLLQRVAELERMLVNKTNGA